MEMDDCQHTLAHLDSNLNVDHDKVKANAMKRRERTPRTSDGEEREAMRRRGWRRRRKDKERLWSWP